MIDWAKWRRGSLLFGLIGVVLVVAALAGLKLTVEAAAGRKARSFLAQVDFSVEDLDQSAVRATLAVNSIYTATLGNQPDRPLLFRLRPYLTHRFVPALLRVQPGAIDTMYVRGLCDNAARTLAFIFEAGGLAAQQLNVVTRSSAHAVVLAEAADGRRLLLDPNKGVIPQGGGRIFSPEKAQAMMRAGSPGGAIWRGLSPTADTNFYEGFADAVFAVQGERLAIQADIRLAPGEVLEIGRADRSIEDTIHEAGMAGMMPHWHYMGSRYDRAWVRRLDFYQDTRVAFGLTEKPMAQFITSSRKPAIDGRELVYTMSAGDTLQFEDGRSGYDWLRLRGYQDVDYIRFERID